MKVGKSVEWKKLLENIVMVIQMIQQLPFDSMAAHEHSKDVVH